MQIRLKYTGLLLLLGCVFLKPVYAARRTLRAFISDIEGHAPPYVTIITNSGTINKLPLGSGLFAIELSNDSSEVLQFSCGGYHSFFVNIDTVHSDSLHVILQKTVHVLNEVSVTGFKENAKEHILGRDNLTKNGHAYMQAGDELAIYLETKKAGTKRLKYVFVYVTDKGNPQCRFKLHFYNEDTATGDPFRRLVERDISAYARSGNEWVRIDVSALDVYFDKGIFVSIEWLGSEPGDSNFLMNPEPGEYYIGSKGHYNGIVPGLTFKYGKHSIYYEKRHGQDNWAYFDPVQLRSRQVKVWKGLNPMIYCVYTNVKGR